MTTETMRRKIDECIKKYYEVDMDGGIRDISENGPELSSADIKEIAECIDSFGMMYEILNGGFNNDSMENFIDLFYSSLTKEEKSFFKDNRDELINYVEDNYFFYYDPGDFDKEIKVNIIIDTGNAKTDFSCDDVLSNCGDGNGLNELSSILWLAKQQGREREFKKAVKDILANKPIKTENAFVNSCIEELENLTSDIGTLTFLVSMSLPDWIDLENKMTANYNNGSLTLTKDTMCGLVDPLLGGGSILGIELENDVTIPFKKIYGCCIDSCKMVRYDVNEIYGLADSCWKHTLININ